MLDVLRLCAGAGPSCTTIFYHLLCLPPDMSGALLLSLQGLLAMLLLAEAPT
jgi:hypothetical protein